MNLEPMNATDAVNVLKFLERQIESGFGSPESIVSLQRVVNHLGAEVRRLVIEPKPAPDAQAAPSFRDLALLAALPVAAQRMPYLPGEEGGEQFVRGTVELATRLASAMDSARE